MSHPKKNTQKREVEVFQTCSICPVYTREGGGESPSFYVLFFFVLFRVGREGVKGE